MRPSDDRLDQLLAEFCDRLLTDRSEGREYSLAHYLELFPSHQDEIAREYLALLAPAESGPDEEASADRPQGAGPASSEGKIGTYRLERPIGHGGQATVWVAHDERLSRLVAIKILDQLPTGSQQALERFRREAQVTSRLDDPGICPIYEIGLSPKPWMAMKLLVGKTLAELIRMSEGKGWLEASPPMVGGDPADSWRSPSSSSGGVRHDLADLSGVLRFFEAIATSLHVAHEAGVVHRDVKPPNIMVTESLRPVILDFGIAMAGDDGAPSLTVSGDRIGTPGYMAPEQVEPKRGAVDRRTDVHALGVTIFEFLAGQRPYQGATRDALYRAILDEPVPDLGRRDRGIGKDLAVVIQTAMAKDPHERYESAAALAADLTRVRLRQPISARPASVTVRLRRWSQRNPKLALVSSGLALALVLSLAIALQLLHSERDRRLTEERADRDRLARVERERQDAEHRLLLAQPAVMRRLLARVPELWPRRIATEPELVAWLDQARQLEERIDLALEELTRLRSLALPRSSEDQAREELIRRQRHPELFQGIDAARSVIANWEAELAAEELPQARRQLIEANVSATRSNLELAMQDPRHTERVVWRFGDQRLTDSHNALDALARGRADLQAARKLVAERRAMARSLYHTSVVEHADVWQVCLEDLRKSQVAGAGAFGPLEGLVPLGRDRDSGLWEFWMPETGGRPGWEGAIEAGRCVLADDSGIVLVLIPGGVGVIGAQRDAPNGARFDPLAHASESPPARIRFDTFLIGKYEVTQAQWLAVMDQNPSEAAAGRPNGVRVTGRHPVERVSQIDAAAFAARLDLLLPTEEQWEYAAQGGSDSRWWFGDDPSAVTGRENISDSAPFVRRKDGHPLHAPVGSFSPNAYGLYDLVGNVSEWTRSPWGPYDNPARSGDGLRVLPPGYRGANNRIYRGGSFRTGSAKVLRSATRGRNDPRTIGWVLGLRVARSFERDR